MWQNNIAHFWSKYIIKYVGPQSRLVSGLVLVLAVEHCFLPLRALNKRYLLT